jgi:hypothetical protein
MRKNLQPGDAGKKRPGLPTLHRETIQRLDNLTILQTPKGGVGQCPLQSQLTETGLNDTSNC